MKQILCIKLVKHWDKLKLEVSWNSMDPIHCCNALKQRRGLFRERDAELIRVFICNRQKVRDEKTARREASRLVHVTRYYVLKVKVKWSLYRPGVAQRVDGGIALLFHDRGTRRGWVVSSTPLPHFTPGKDPVPIVQEAGWAPGPVWTGGKSRPHWDSIPDRPARTSVAIPTELPEDITY